MSPRTTPLREVAEQTVPDLAERIARCRSGYQSFRGLSRELAAVGVSVSFETLRSWATDDADALDAEPQDAA